MQVKDLMSTDVAVLSPEDNLYEAACLMRDQNVGAIPIVKQGKLIGMITDRDIVVRGVAEKRPNSLRVDKLMSSYLVQGSPDMRVAEAAQIMGEAQVRRLPIVEQGRLVGMVSLGDLALHQESKNEMQQAISEISETHNPQQSNDLPKPPLH
jgi:CBS domain-containing protein